MVPMSLSKENKTHLLNLAKKSIQHGLQTGQPLQLDLTNFPFDLTNNRATFVTLQIHDQLRGCIGMLEAIRPLAVDVSENAYSAAFKDPRFPPLSWEEYDQLEIHISILTHPEQISFESEQELISQLRPHIDGLILEEGLQRGTFLPSVWEQLPKADIFLRHLKQKAGLSADYWSNNIRAYRYQAEIIR